MTANIYQQTGIISASTNLSLAITYDGLSLIGVQVPANWTAAALSFQISDDGTNFFVGVDQYGAEISLAVVAGKRTVVPPMALHGVKKIKLQSGTSASPVTQVSSVTLTLIGRNFF